MCHLRKTVDNSQDHRITFRRGQARDKIHHDVWPGAVRDGQGTKQPCRSLMGSLTSGADSTSGDKLLSISSHGGSPEALLQEDQGPAKTRLTGNPGRVSPLENWRPDRHRNKQTVGWTSLWHWLIPLSPLDHSFNLPSRCSHHTGGWHYGAPRRVLDRRGKLPWQGIWFYVPRTRSVGDSEVEPPKEQSPPSLELSLRAVPTYESFLQGQDDS